MEYEEYLKAHGLYKDYVEKKWGWRYADNRIYMPNFDKNGHILETPYRNFNLDEPKFLRTEGEKPNLYGQHIAKDVSTLVYCEGQADCVKLWQEGIPAITDTSGVHTIKEEWAAKLTGKNIYICLDSDDEGQKNVEKYYHTLEKYANKVYIIDLPKQYKDVCEFFTSEGLSKSDFKILIDQAADSVDEWVIAHTPPEHGVETLSDLLKTELPPEQWIIDGIVPIAGFSVIAGEEATGKSFLALSMAIAAVNGQPWLGQFNVEKTCKVLILDKENQRVIAQDRARGFGVGSEGDNIYRIIYPDAFTFENLDGGKERFSPFARYISTFVRYHDIQFIILDSYIDFMPGDENKVDATMAFFNWLRELFPGRSIMFLSHYVKPTQSIRTPAQMISGSHAISAVITSGLAVTRGDASNQFYLQKIKPRNAANDKRKMEVWLETKNDPINPNRTLVGRIKFDKYVEEVNPQKESALQIIKDRLSTIDENGVSRAELMELVVNKKISKETAKLALSEIISTNFYEYRKIGAGSGNKKAFYPKDQAKIW